jgi:hypothetical protein
MTLDRIVMVAVVVLLGGGAAYVQVVRPAWAKSLQPGKEEAVKEKVAEVKTEAKPQVEPPKVVAPTPAPAPVVAPPAAPPQKTATTSSFVHMRQGKSTATPILYDLDGGTTVILRDDADPSWQGVIYQGTSGYIYKDYLLYN